MVGFRVLSLIPEGYPVQSLVITLRKHPAELQPIAYRSRLCPPTAITNRSAILLFHYFYYFFMPVFLKSFTFVSRLTRHRERPEESRCLRTIPTVRILKNKSPSRTHRRGTHCCDSILFFIFIISLLVTPAGRCPAPRSCFIAIHDAFSVPRQDRNLISGIYIDPILKIAQRSTSCRTSHRTVAFCTLPPTRG